MKKLQQISAEDSNYIESLFFRYNATKDIISFLMTNENVNQDLLARYMETAEQRFVELELAKKAVFEKYINDDISFYNYTFNFQIPAIEYARGM